MESFVVIGLGRFGSAVAERLCQEGHQVLAVDVDEKVVQNMADKVTQAVAGDCQEMDVLRALGVQDMNCAVVAFSNDIGKSVLVTLNLKELGVPQVICKSKSHVHRRVLEKIGADRVVFPEHEMGVKLAQGLSSSNVLNFIELSEDFGIVETAIPRAWHFKTIKELDVRAKFKVNIIAMRKGKDGALNVAPGPDYTMEPGDAAVALGRTEDVNRLQDLE
ncbi:TrkA family potassium uptake protein [uncultured Oscillibacter sp.]|uniref:potassium channel family protein n=1 Tax=uncultured Oscillibacter sp. TaxID=876091 RepID=UPI0026335417|nr:TrkA family potassium uptake protein [uncultured Oscillibacter sp.]